MFIVPLAAVPAQTLTVVLNDQVCQIAVRQLSVGVAVDLAVNNAAIVNGVLGFNLNRIVRSAYLGFQGDLAFVDYEGSDDPVYTGFGTRFFLCYFPPDEL